MRSDPDHGELDRTNRRSTRGGLPADRTLRSIGPAPASTARGQSAFWTLPPLRQRVQTYTRLAAPFTRTRTRWRFGSKRRFVATIEWLRLWPNEGPLPQTEQTLDMSRPEDSCRSEAAHLVGAVGPLRARERSRPSDSTISSAERAASTPLLPWEPPGPRLRLRERVAGQHAEGDGTPVSRPASCTPLAASELTKSKCGVSPRITQPSASTHEYRRDFASAIAASGSSNAPGTGMTSIASAATPAAARARRARRSSRRDVIPPLNLLTAIPTERRAPFGGPPNDADSGRYGEARPRRGRGGQ